MTESCPYPGCTSAPSPDNPKARQAFCVDHAKAKCRFAEMGIDNVPQCASLVTPHSGWCKRHNDEKVRFDFLHAIHHQQALAQQTQAILNKIGGNGTTGLTIARR